MNEEHAMMVVNNFAHWAEVGGRYAAEAADSVRQAAAEHCAPSVKFRPALSIDGGKWCALYGQNLQDGCAGFGDSPAEAMADFDREWLAVLPKSLKS